jgi:hypothetical protein
VTPDTLTLIKDLTLGGWAILVLIMGARKWWYFGHAYAALEKQLEEMRADRDRFLNMALAASDQAETALSAGEQVATLHRATRR